MGILGSVPGVPQAPEIELDMPAVVEAISEAVQSIPENIAKNKRDFPGEIANCDGDFDVPDTTMILNKDSTEDDINNAAIISACGSAVKDAIKDSIWGQIEPKIDEQLDACEPTLPDKIKNFAKDKFKEKTIDVLVDAAVDKCLEEAKKAMNSNVEEEAADIDDAGDNNENNENNATEGNPTENKNKELLMNQSKIKSVNNEMNQENMLLNSKHDILRQQISNNKQAIVDANSESKQINLQISELNGKMEQIKELNKFNVDDLKKKNVALIEQTNEMKESNESMQSEIVSLNNKLNSFGIQQKELLTKNQQLKIEMKQLKEQAETTYMNWGADKIVTWIVSLDSGRYLKYREILQESLTNEGVTGKHLGQVDEADIKSWGVVQFDDKKDLSMKIKQLIDKNGDIQQDDGSDNDLYELYDDLFEDGDDNTKTNVNCSEKHENKFETDENAIDISYSNIKPIASYPELNSNDLDEQLKNAMNAQPTEMMILGGVGKTKDAWFSLDMGKIKVDTLEIGFFNLAGKEFNLYATIVKILTSVDNETFKMIKIKNNITAETKLTFVLGSKHSRYIRIAFQDRPNEDAVGINKLKLNGHVLKEKNSITDNITVYQANNYILVGATIQNIMNPNVMLKNNANSFKFATEPKAWVIFDCKRYELEKFIVRFKTNKEVPRVVKLKLSDIAPRVFFDTPSVYKWNIDIPNERHCYETVDQWSNISQLQEFKLSGKEYNGGFKRYAMLEFSKYHEEQIEIERIQVFGHVSTRILDDDEQFPFDDELGEEKKDSSEPYKPDFVDSSATQEGMPLENMWNKEDFFFWMSVPGTEPYLVLDLGNNEKQLKQMFVKAFPDPNYIAKTLKISTSDKIKSGWKLLFEDNEMESKIHDGGKYDMVKYDVKKYIKLEFFELKMCGISSIKLYGDGKFLDKIERDITIEDIKNLKCKDEDLIQQYKEKIKANMTARWMSKLSECRIIEQNKDKGKGCDEWVKLKTEYYEIQAEMNYMYTPILAYTADTIYEQETLLRSAKQQKKMGKEMVQKLVQHELDSANAEKLFQLTKEYTDKISNLAVKSINYEIVFNVWKNAIINDCGRSISNAYTVQEYDNATQQYGRMNDEDGLKKCFRIIAEQFDKSIKDRKEYLHKYFVYQLNSGFPLYVFKFYARPSNYGTPPVTILFDVGDDLDQKVNRIEFKCKTIGTNAITVSTSDALREEKCDSLDSDDEMRYDYTHFNAIGRLEFDDEIKSRRENGVTYDDTCIQLNYKNRRYIKVEFDEWDETEDTTLQIERVRFYCRVEDTSIVDEDSKEGGEQLKKYKLKFVTDSNENTNWTGNEEIKKAYQLDGDTYYETPFEEQMPYIIFDAETRKVNKFEIMLTSWSDLKFNNFKILTTDENGYDAIKKPKPNQDNWKIIFEEENINEDRFKEYIDSDKVKSILLGGENDQYVMFLWELKDKSHQLSIKQLKFYTTDPTNEYKWDIDQNIKNLTYKVKILDANKCESDQKPENMLGDNDGESYSFSARQLAHKEKIEDKVRDEVCRGINLLRKSRGGKISKDEKKFIKYLLCFQNERNYDEMLYQAKLVMRLLRKSLDSEYNRLQSINSQILSLKLDKQHKCSDEIVSNHKLLEWDYNQWYKPRNAMFWPDDLKPLADEWENAGLILTDPEFKQLQRTTTQEPEKPFVTSDELVMEYLNLIAYKLDCGFQKQMKQLFKENRIKMGRSFPTGNDDLNVQSGPIKTKARQKIKVDLKYFEKPSPQCMAVSDIVRCGIVCEDDKELCSLYQLIMERYNGSIMRVKNAFDDIKKGDDSYGYRAVMINIVFSDESLLPKNYKMICEAQLLLNKYYQVRKNMHLCYSICRSEDGGKSENTAPYIVLARDCAKFGKLDI